ncbi:MAG: baseplate J/gp47 family protein [Pseudomonadales bacterium]|nr:baseplate J/gp47 family protein [Pseudomonadales bacterium]
MSTLIDLSKLPAPQLIEEVSFDALLQLMLDDLAVRMPELVIGVSDPAYKVLEVAAYRLMLERQRINEMAQGVLLARAIGSDLDQLGALMNVQRLVLVAADPDAVPPVAQVLEADDDFRLRIQLKLESITTAGAIGAYQFHGQAADPKVAEVAVSSPAPTQVLVTVLSTEGDGAPDQAMLDAVTAALNADDVRPLTDLVTVQGVTVVGYTIDADLFLADGPDVSVVQAQAVAQLDAYLASRRRIGADIPRSGIIAALHVSGVEKVVLTTPPADVVIDEVSVASASAITIGEGV